MKDKSVALRKNLSASYSQNKFKLRISKCFLAWGYTELNLVILLVLKRPGCGEEILRNVLELDARGSFEDLATTNSNFTARGTFRSPQKDRSGPG